MGPSLSPVAHSQGAQSESAKRASTSTVSEQGVRMFLTVSNVFTEPVSEFSNSLLSWSSVFTHSVLSVFLYLPGAYLHAK
jgi:hypothetical protein